MDPPRRVAFTYHSSRAESDAQSVEVSFLPEGTGTRVELVHSGFTGISQTILRKFMMGPGWSRMLEQALPGVIEHVTPSGFVPRVAKGECGGC